MPIHATLVTQWADSEAEVREAQRLRYLVFAQEMGAITCSFVWSGPTTPKDCSLVPNEL